MWSAPQYNGTWIRLISNLPSWTQIGCRASHLRCSLSLESQQKSWMWPKMSKKREKRSFLASLLPSLRPPTFRPARLPPTHRYVPVSSSFSLSLPDVWMCIVFVLLFIRIWSPPRFWCCQTKNCNLKQSNHMPVWISPCPLIVANLFSCATSFFSFFSSDHRVHRHWRRWRLLLRHLYERQDRRCHLQGSL